jgi:hypothetical protein
MRNALPLILILLALFSDGCIAYIAWELSSGKQDSEPRNSEADENSSE